MKSSAIQTRQADSDGGKRWLALENPFLQRELRQFARRPRAVQIALFVCLGAMAVILMCWLWNAENPTWLKSSPGNPPLSLVMRWLLVTTHIILCAIAAGYGCYRLFAAEHLRSTFELTQLLPYSPLRWLLLKLAFPALGVLISWLAGYPFYLLAALYNLIPLNSLFFQMHKPLLAGIGVMLLSLIATPEYIRRTQQRQAQVKGLARGQRVSPDFELEMWGIVLVLFIYALIAGLTLSWGIVKTPRPLYRLAVPEALYWIAGFGLLIPPAFLTAFAALVPQERWEVRAHQARVASLVASYYLFLGLIWSYLGFWYQLIAALFPVVRTLFALARRNKGRDAKERPANLQSEREVQWVIKRYPNALLMRDLRVYSRFTSIRQSFCWMLGLVLLFPLGWLGITLYGVPPWAGVAVKRVVPQLAIQTLIGLFAGTWGRPAMLWHKERAAKTLPLLLITPMSSREILFGRLMASPLYQMAGQSPLLVLALLGVGWTISKGSWFAGPLCLALLPLVPSVGIWTGCHPPGPAVKPRGVREWAIIVALLIVQLLLVTGTIYLFINGINIGTKVGLGPLLYWIYGVLLGIGNGLLAWGWFEFRVKQLDKFRMGDMELPDSKELAPIRSKRRSFGRAKSVST